LSLNFLLLLFSSVLALELRDPLLKLYSPPENISSVLGLFSRLSTLENEA